jgi:hypothetical protein
MGEIVSGVLVSNTKGIIVRPKYVAAKVRYFNHLNAHVTYISKGGIMISDIATKELGMEKARVIG